MLKILVAKWNEDFQEVADTQHITDQPARRCPVGAGHDGEWGRAMAHIEDSFCKFKIKHYLCGPKIYVDRFGLLATTLKNAKITFHISVLCF